MLLVFRKARDISLFPDIEDECFMYTYSWGCQEQDMLHSAYKHCTLFPAYAQKKNTETININLKKHNQMETNGLKCHHH